MLPFLVRFFAVGILLASSTMAFVSPAEATMGSLSGTAPMVSETLLARTGISLALAPHLTEVEGEPQAEPDQKRHLRRLLKKEITRSIALESRRIIGEYHQEEFGTEIEFFSAGQPYVARIEQHYHPPGGEARPWGYHAGVSVLVTQTNP